MELKPNPRGEAAKPHGRAYEPDRRQRDEAVDDRDIRSRVQMLTVRQQRFERSLAKRLGVDAAGLETLDHLIASGPSTPTELAHRLGISTAAMTLVLNRLEASGHVRRERHPSDGRKLLVIADPEAAAEVERLVMPLIERVETLISSMDDFPRTIVASFLDELIRRYDDVVPPSNELWINH